MPIRRGNEIYANFLLPKFFSKSWKNTYVDEKVLYLDFSSELLFDTEIDNQPFVQKLFSTNNSFDCFLIQKQWEKICFTVKKILDFRVKNKKEILIRKNEINFIQYFYFVTSMVNGDTKFYFEESVKTYHSFDVFNKNINEKIQYKILCVIQHALFDLCDFLVNDNLNSDSINDYIENSYTKFTELNVYNKIFVPVEEFNDDKFCYLLAHFQTFLNESYIKFYDIPKNNVQNFYLSNKSIVNFIDDNSKKNLFNILVWDPYYAIGFINLGKGKGKKRDFLKYFKEDIDGQILMPSALVPEHNLVDEGEYYWNDKEKYKFKLNTLSLKQTETINEGLCTRVLKFGLFQFYEDPI